MKHTLIEKSQIFLIRMCGSGWGVFGEHCYIVESNDGASWNDASAACESMGATLACIETTAENAFIEGLVGEDSWVGYSDSATEGDFKWISKCKSNYDNFAYGQPNIIGRGGETEDCVLMEPTGEWRDLDCATFLPYICERDAFSPTTAPWVTPSASPTVSPAPASVPTASPHSPPSPAPTDTSIVSDAAAGKIPGVASTGVTALSTACGVLVCGVLGVIARKKKALHSQRPRHSSQCNGGREINVDIMGTPAGGTSGSDAPIASARPGGEVQCGRVADAGGNALSCTPAMAVATLISEPLPVLNVGVAAAYPAI